MEGLADDEEVDDARLGAVEGTGDSGMEGLWVGTMLGNALGNKLGMVLEGKDGDEDEALLSNTVGVKEGNKEGI